ncbi:segregation and condensation protein A [Blastochloris viridis]|uniref:Segregation and condensation protein A n=1 Tax=Blastochloris viridis TaxID=1079 RepID=A0A0H5BEY9_BLAVI|nr:ScpA family protein [Blastochloris viridis]ALK09331.1 Segregation and condensation protein A [Blastochloris viridis]BAS00791.1 segregation and condensation protein A [Blastochloris viridis]CUU41994.1 Segregation and condensation protein A [Blastochloris viridis]
MLDAEFESSHAGEAPAEAALVVEVDGFEGPLDLLLNLARSQKVDLAKISILALADQYLGFVERAHQLRIELAADYLVMAAWLAYLKSRLLLPEPPKGEEPSAVDMAANLAFRLQRLEAIRTAAASLTTRDRLGHDVFGRGKPEPTLVPRAGYAASLYDLLAAYAAERQKRAHARVTVAKRQVWSLAEARSLLQRLAGSALDWTCLDEYLIQWTTAPGDRTTVRASSLAASLELVREGAIEIQQERPFAPVWVRRRSAAVS